MEVQEDKNQNIKRTPIDVWSAIFRYLDNKSKFNASLTCKLFKTVIETDPAIYKTFKINFRQNLERLKQITRPIADVTLAHINILSGEFETLEAVISFFQRNGKFISKLKLDDVDMDQDIFFLIANTLNNAVTVFFSGNLRNNEVENFQVKNHLKLKSLSLYVGSSTKDLSNDILQEFFGRSKRISTLGLSYNFNIVYNKPKLQKLAVYFGGCSQFIMDDPKTAERGHLKELNFIFKQPLPTDRTKWNWDKFDEYINGTQQGIEKLIAKNMDQAFFMVTSNYRGLLESLRLTNLTYLTLSAARIGLQQQMFENITITFLKNNPNIVDLTINVPFDVNSKSIETQKYILINLPHLKRYCCHPKFTTFNDKSIDAVTFFQLFLSENIKLETLVFKTPQTTNNLKEIIQFGVQLFRRKKPSMKFSCA